MWFRPRSRARRAPLLHGLGVVAQLGAQGGHPHLRGGLSPLEQGDAQLDDVLGALLPGHAQLAEDVLDAAALPGQGRLRRGSGSPSGEDALDGLQGLFVFDLAGDVLDDLADFDEVDGLLDEEVHPGGIGPGHHLLGRHLGDHDELGPAAPLLQLTHHLDAVLPRHEQVH